MNNTRLRGRFCDLRETDNMLYKQIFDESPSFRNKAKELYVLPKDKTTVGGLITLLSNFPNDMEVLVTDGFLGNHYSGVYTVEEFEGCVGIGACME